MAVAVTIGTATAETAINSSQIIEDLTSSPPTRYPLLLGVTPIGPNRRFIAIISGPTSEGYPREGATGAVIFNQALEEMTPGTHVLLPDKGQPLEQVLPDLVEKVYRGKDQRHPPEPLSMMCFGKRMCVVFAKTGPQEVTTWDLFSSPQTEPCIAPELWDRISGGDRVIPLPAGDLPNAYYSYQAHYQGVNFTGSLALSTHNETLFFGYGTCPRHIRQTTAPVRYLCNRFGRSEFAYEKEACGGQLFSNPVTAGFVFEDTVYLMPAYDFDVLVLPKDGFEEGDSKATLPLTVISKKDFWRKNWRGP